MSLYSNGITKAPCVTGQCSSGRFWRQANGTQGLSFFGDVKLRCWAAHETKGCLTSFIVPRQPSEEHCWFDLGMWRGRSSRLWLGSIPVELHIFNQNGSFSTPAKGCCLASVSLAGQDEGRERK